MRVYLRKDIEKIGMAGEIIKVGDGYARNYLIPHGFAIEINKKNESSYQEKAQSVEHRKEVIATQTSMLAEKIKTLKLTLKRKVHDDGKLYGSINSAEIVELLLKKGISIAKNQVTFNKSIKTKGSHKLTIKLTSRLKPQLSLTIIPE